MTEADGKAASPQEPKRSDEDGNGPTILGDPICDRGACRRPLSEHDGWFCP